MNNVEAAARLVSSKTLRLVGLVVAAGLARAQDAEAPLRTTALAAAGGHLAGATVSRVVRRERPPSAEQNDRSSFPSTHAASAFAFAAALGDRAPRLRTALFAGATVVAASRLVLEEHYATDVIAGALLGVAVGDLLGTRWARR
jgi:undecaprenyl-diphosphatase